MNERVHTAGLQPRLSAGSATHGVDASALLHRLFSSFDGQLTPRLASTPVLVYVPVYNFVARRFDPGTS